MSERGHKDSVKILPVKILAIGVLAEI